jgi:Flp pilus assembly pilin Flp
VQSRKTPAASRIPVRGCFDERRRNTKMDLIRKLYVKADEFARGQTMAEYALILAAVAVIVYAGYQIMGTTITTMLTSVDNQL